MKFYITLNYKGSVLFLKKHRELQNKQFQLDSFTNELNDAWVSNNPDTTNSAFYHAYYHLHELLNIAGDELQTQTAQTLKINDNYIHVFNESTGTYWYYEVQPDIHYGFKSFGINLWPDSWLDTYNNYTGAINRANDQKTRDLLLDNRHKFFMWCDNELTKEKIKEVAA